MNLNPIIISGQHSGPRLLILGGVHGDEYEPIAALRRLSREVCPAQLRGELILIPVVNVPAFLGRSRTGPDHLDLARTMPGQDNGSVTEQIASELARQIRQSDSLIDLHTGGLAMQISPLTGYLLHADAEVLDVQRRMAEAFNLPLIWGTNPSLEGRTLSTARDAGVPSIYAEWGGGTGCHPQGVTDYVQGCLNVMRELQMISHPIPEKRIRIRVEDSRDESGVLQKNYPAPEDGFFEPAVELNQRVQPGDLLGTISSVEGDSSTEIRFTQRGIVILLRVIPAVLRGECLSTVLESDGDGEFRYE